MKRLVLVAALALASEAAAEGKKASRTAASVTGHVQSVGERIVVTDRSGKELRLQSDADTKVTRGGQVVGRDALEQGTPVRASFEWNGNDRIARDVVILESED